MSNVIKTVTYSANGKDFHSYFAALESTMPGLPSVILALYKVNAPNLGTEGAAAYIPLIRAVREASNKGHGATVSLKDAKDYVEMCIGRYQGTEQ